MLKKTKLRSLFAKMKTGMRSSQQNLPSKTITGSSRWYQNITELPLNKFIDCIIDNNLQALVISGNPSQKNLFSSWENIRIQYADAIRNHDYTAFAKLNADILKLEIFISQVNDLVYQLSRRYVRQFHEKLNALMAYKFQFDLNDFEQYDKELQKVLNRSKGQLVDLKLKKMNFDSMVEAMASKGNVLSRESFYQNVITLSDFAEYRLSIDSMTVFEYCDRLRRLNDHMKQKKSANG